MKPSRHIAVSFSLGLALWFFTKSFPAAILCFISGIFMDLDHIIEYLIQYGLKDFTLRNVYNVSINTPKRHLEQRFKKLYLVFHSWEIAILLIFLAAYTKNIYVFAFAAGYFIHLVMDYLGNELYCPSYFIIYRAMKKFDTDKLIEEDRGG